MFAGAKTSRGENNQKTIYHMQKKGETMRRESRHAEQGKHQNKIGV